MHAYTDMYMINTKTLAEVSVNMTTLQVFSNISCLAVVLSHFIIMMLLISKLQEKRRVSVNFPCQCSKVVRNAAYFRGVILRL